MKGKKRVKKIKYIASVVLFLGLGLVISQPVNADETQTSQVQDSKTEQTTDQNKPEPVKKKKPKKKVVKVSVKSKRWVKKQLKKMGFKGNATVYANGKKVYSYTSANHVNSEYLINSVQKSLTAGILMKQAGRKINLSNKLSKYYPKVPGAKKITILHLLRMTSGLYQNGNRIKFSKKYYNKWHYADINYVLIRRILEKVTHKKYTTLFYKTYKKPLKLKHTHYIWQRNRHLASPAWAINYSSERSILGASDSTMSNGDLFKVIHALMSGKILNKKEQAQLYNPPKKSSSHYCGGFYNHGKYRTANGAGYGYYTLIRISKDGQQALILQTNRGDGFGKYRSAANRIYHHLF